MGLGSFLVSGVIVIAPSPDEKPGVHTAGCFDASIVIDCMSLDVILLLAMDVFRRYLHLVPFLGVGSRNEYLLLVDVYKLVEFEDLVADNVVVH